ncbi:hypothetical protein [Bartonella sp. B1099]|uniref:hypothetical protein n=1 Tax=Bartonella sp. B1099 TaxID=2911422 RepID=UPI0020C48E50|nr:hypothetical protein [Bartonella sp. B1099]
MCIKKLWKDQKNDFGVFIEHKNNLEYEGGRLVECDTHDQCFYEDGGAFDDTTVYNKLCVYDDIFVYSNALIYGRLEG